MIRSSADSSAPHDETREGREALAKVKVDYGAWLLEIEAEIMLTRARMLHNDNTGFIEHLLIARRTLAEFVARVLVVGESTGNYFLADSIGREQQPASTGTSGSVPSEAKKSNSHSPEGRS